MVHTVGFVQGAYIAHTYVHICMYMYIYIYIYIYAEGSYRHSRVYLGFGYGNLIPRKSFAVWGAQAMNPALPRALRNWANIGDPTLWLGGFLSP